MAASSAPSWDGSSASHRSEYLPGFAGYPAAVISVVSQCPRAWRVSGQAICIEGAEFRADRRGGDVAGDGAPVRQPGDRCGGGRSSSDWPLVRSTETALCGRTGSGAGRSVGHSAVRRRCGRVRRPFARRPAWVRSVSGVAGKTGRAWYYPGPDLSGQADFGCPPFRDTVAGRVADRVGQLSNPLRGFIFCGRPRRRTGLDCPFCPVARWRVAICAGWSGRVRPIPGR